jgi:diguanylate cyclase (GGDEF)-like protein/PAS domain S-box-containing protein
MKFPFSHFPFAAPNRSERWRRTTLLALGLLALLTYVALVAVGLKISHNREVEFATRNLENLANVLEAQARGTIDKIDTILLASQLRLNEAYAGESRDRKSINATLARYLALIDEESQSLRIANADGTFIHDASGTLSSVHIGDRDYFLRNRNDASGRLIISEPLFARITNNWVITLSRRISDTHGQFAGLVQAAVRAEYFRDFFAGLKLGAGQSLTLIDHHQRLIARYPEAPERLGQTVANPVMADIIAHGERQGTYTVRSSIDGVERLYAIRQVGDYPLYVIVGQATDEYLANWQRQFFWGIFSTLVLATILAGWIIVWLRTYDRARQLAKGMTRAYETTMHRTRALLDSLPDPAWLSDRRLRLIAVNEAYTRICGKPQDKILGCTVGEIWPVDTAQPLAAQESATLAQNEQQRRKGSQHIADGSLCHFEYITTPVLDDRDELAGVAGVARDITQIHEDELRIRHLAEHDLLTDLPNRILLSEHMSLVLAETLGEHAEIALLFLDLDHFKNINDTLGHEIGDQLLLQAAKRLRGSLDARDTVSRQGGDEFAVLVRNYGTPARLADIAQRLIDTIDQPFLVAGHELQVGVSIGISTYPQDGKDINTLLKNADTAMYQAKAVGGNAYRFFTQEMNARIFERVTLENSLRRAIPAQELFLHYQPQMDVESGRLIGLEALVRWRHPEFGDVPPARFIPIAEDSNLINQIGDWVLREACRQNRAWQDMGLPPVVMAVNLSAVQLRQSGLAGKITGILAETGLDARWLELEITESALINDIERIIGVLEELSAEGIKLSVDDFGTGYSSLGYLKRLPFDRIKIDQSFVRDLPNNPDDIAIVRAIVAIADSLQKEVIAEGVEQPCQIDFLRQQGCRLMQGFHFSRPVSPEAILAFLQQGSPAANVAGE